MIIKNILKVFKTLDIHYLDNLSSELNSSEGNREELKEHLKKLFHKIREKGVESLRAESSSCLYCYPLGKAYKFYDPETDDFIFKYVFEEQESGFFVIEQCKNNPIPDALDGMPF